MFRLALEKSTEMNLIGLKLYSFHFIDKFCLFNFLQQMTIFFTNSFTNSYLFRFSQLPFLFQIIEKKILKEYFVHQISNITSDYKLDLAAWEDGVMESGSKPFRREALQNQNVYAYAWDNIWEWGQSNRAYKLANAGYKVS